MYFLWLPSWALAIVSPSKHPPIKCIFTKLFSWITENLEIFSQDSYQSIKPFACYKHNWESNSSVTCYGPGKLHGSWTGQIHWKQGKFLQSDICISAEDKGIRWSHGLLSLTPEKETHHELKWVPSLSMATWGFVIISKVRHSPRPVQLFSYSA